MPSPSSLKTSMLPFGLQELIPMLVTHLDFILVHILCNSSPTSYLYIIIMFFFSSRKKKSELVYIQKTNPPVNLHFIQTL